MVGLATCWLHPQAIYGLPPSNEASLGIVRQGCLGLRGLANRHVGKLELEEELEKLGLAEDRQDLCDRLEARNGLRERDRWKVLTLFPPGFWFTR